MKTSLLLLAAIAASAAWPADTVNTADDSYWREVTVFGGEELRHADYVTFTAFSPDSQSVISTSQDGRCRVWDFNSGALKSEFFAANAIWSAALIDGGKAIVLCTRNDQQHSCVERWDLATRQRLWSTETPFDKGYPEQLVAGLDAPEAVVVSHWNAGGLWRVDLKSGEQVGERYKSKDIEEVSVSRDGGTILAMPRDHLMLRFNAALERQWQILIADYGYHDLLLTPDAKSFYLPVWPSAPGGARVQRYSVETGELESTVTTSFKRVPYLASLFPDGSTMLEFGDDGVGRVVSAENGELQYKLPGMVYSRCIAISPDGARAVSVGDTLIRRWDLKTHAQLPLPAGHAAPVFAMAVSPDGKMIASCCNRPPGASVGESDCIRLWDAASGRELRAFHDANQSSIAHVLFSRDSKTLYSAETIYKSSSIYAPERASARLAARDPVTGALKFATDVQEPGPDSYNQARWLALSRDGKTIYLSTLHYAFVFDAATGAELRRFETGVYVCSIALMDDDTLLAVGDGGYWTEGPGDVRLRLFDIKTGALHCTFPPGDDRYFSSFDLRVTPDSHTLAIASPGYSWLNDPITDNRMNLLFVRTPHFQPTPEAAKVRALIPNLSDDSIDTRDQASVALKAFGPAARPVVEEALKLAEPESRARLKDALAAYTKLELPRGAGGVDLGANVEVYSVDIDPNGKRFVAVTDASADTFTYLVTGEFTVDGNDVSAKVLHRQRVIRHPQRVRFLPDGAGIVTGNSDGTLALFRPQAP